MKSLLVFFGIVLALLTTPALADSIGINNQDLLFGSTIGGGFLAGATVNSIAMGNSMSPASGMLVFGIGELLGAFSSGGTFSSGIASLDFNSIRIFATNFAVSWTEISSNLYLLSGTFSSGGIYGATVQAFQVDFANGVACFRDVSGSTIISTVPEPGSLALLGTGLVGLAGAARRKLSRQKVWAQLRSRSFKPETGTESGNC